MNWKSVAFRAKRNTSNEEFYEYQALSQDEKDVLHRRSRINSVKFKLGIQIFLTIMTSYLSFISVLSWSENWSTEEYFNTGCLIVASIACFMIVMYRLNKIRKEGYDVYFRK